jgi:hypothetical protein
VVAQYQLNLLVAGAALDITATRQVLAMLEGRVVVVEEIVLVQM